MSPPSATPGPLERKYQLLARAEFERLQVRRAVDDLRAVVAGPARSQAAVAASPRVSAILGVVLPLLGPERAARVVQVARVGLGVARMVQGLRARRP